MVASCGTPVGTPESKPASVGQSGSTELAEDRKRLASEEANNSLRRMYDAARVYYATPDFPVEYDYSLRTKQLPRSAPITPSLGTCCRDGGKCQVRAELWEHPVWFALEFEPKKPHYLSYAFQTSTNGNENTFTAIAYSDVDCAGSYTSYSLSGAVVDGETTFPGEVLTKQIEK